jgi:hypothetical protein
MRGYEVPSEALTIETARALDYAFCREHIPHLPPLTKLDRQKLFYLQSGVNEVLSRVLPTNLAYAEPALYLSSPRSQERADEFLFDAGVLNISERLLTQLRAGFLEGRIDPVRQVRGMQILVLTAKTESLYLEGIGRAGVAWLSERAREHGLPKEEELRSVREAMLPEIEKRLLSGADPDEELCAGADRHFQECASVYLSRVPYQDLLGANDSIGGRKFSDYVQALTTLSTLLETRLCLSAVLDSIRPEFGLRNILTGISDAGELVEAVASHMDAETVEINQLLGHFVLSPRNAQLHLGRGTPAWAPIIQTSANFCVLPCFGLDMNPFVFLMTELRERYKSDWFSAANAREARWIVELRTLFPSPRWICADGVKIKRNSKVITDIDFLAYDISSGEVALFQLKWQQPSVSDERSRRSNASNLVGESNRWISVVSDWVLKEGMEEIAKRLQVPATDIKRSRLFVLGRYAAHFSGQSDQDARAVWSDWGNFERERTENPAGSVEALTDGLKVKLFEINKATAPDSFMIPLPGLAVVLNPTQIPPDISLPKS